MQVRTGTLKPGDFIVYPDRMSWLIISVVSTLSNGQVITRVCYLRQKRHEFNVHTYDFYSDCQWPVTCRVSV